MADGTSKPSVQANNSKNPNRVNKKILHTVGPYKPKAQELHKPGTILIGNRLLAILADYNLDFKDGEVAKIKNSPMQMQMFINGQGQPSAKIIELH